MNPNLRRYIETLLSTPGWPVVRELRVTTDDGCPPGHCVLGVAYDLMNPEAWTAPVTHEVRGRPCSSWVSWGRPDHLTDVSRWLGGVPADFLAELAAANDSGQFSYRALGLYVLSRAQRQDWSIMTLNEYEHFTAKCALPVAPERLKWFLEGVA